MAVQQGGIWTSRLLEPMVDDEFQLTLGEGNTELCESEGIWFKREDLNPTGSVKDRGMAYQLSRLIEQGHRRFVISSSGNAGISAAEYCIKVECELKVFVSEGVDPSKLRVLEQLGVDIVHDARPVSSAHRWAKAHDYYNLRPGNDELGTVGYRSIAEELALEMETVDSMFFPVSSGTTLAGVGEGFRMLGIECAMFAVQTEQVHPLMRGEPVVEDASVATGLVDRVMHRRQEVFDMVSQSGGDVIVVGNKEIRKAYEWLHAREMRVSYDAAVSLAGLWKAQTLGMQVGKRPVCLLTGMERG